MKLISEINTLTQQAQFKQSPLYYAIPLMIFLSLIGGVIYWHHFGDFPVAPAIWLSAFLGLFALFMFSHLKKTLAPTNWILALDHARLFIKFRSYLNPHFPKMDPQIIQCRLSEIESAHVTKQTLTQLGPKGGRSTSHLTFLDLTLADQDLSPLKEQLKHERDITPPLTGRYFKGRSKSRHYPVSVVNDRIIRVEWRAPTAWITPRIKKAIEFLRGEKIRIDPLNKEVVDLTWSPADQTSAEDHILFLAERGDILAATKLARRNLGMSLTEARKFVDELSSTK